MSLSVCVRYFNFEDDLPGSPILIWEMCYSKTHPNSYFMISYSD